MISTLKLVVNCEVLSVKENFHGTCFGHAFSKACQYATMDEKVLKGLKYVSIKTIHGDLQKIITWHKELEKSR
jgi:hypothetical protein